VEREVARRRCLVPAEWIVAVKRSTQIGSWEVVWQVQRPRLLRQVTLFGRVTVGRCGLQAASTILYGKVRWKKRQATLAVGIQAEDVLGCR
jgi:hypothetical protein